MGQEHTAKRLVRALERLPGWSARPLRRQGGWVVYPPRGESFTLHTSMAGGTVVRIRARLIDAGVPEKVLRLLPRGR